MEDFIPLIIALPALYLLLSGLSRIVRRRAPGWRWHYEPPNRAVRQRTEINGFRAVFSGLLRLGIGGVLFFILLQLLQ